MRGRILMLQVNVLVLFSVLSAKNTKIVLIVSVSVVLGVEMEFFDQSQMQDLPFMNTIEHNLCSSYQKRDREKKAFMSPGKVFVLNQSLILGGDC